ncbi:LytR/AlgR family response regulator transcription factor [Luteibaculum oceani]|uniref:Response regulator transcription factor n=1 Tax=Luteibaculum oceani TaxID=1294296 RepID=A0A5C6VJB7_9FLAO|nr:LytTR family DNA-binding domain-containing protein [Luteibaculum oceani]TXC85357.1 hypothetical protein FRX97_01660 [Luteibaculum oceani]
MSGLNVLIADLEPIPAKDLELNLKKLGHQVSAMVHSGEDFSDLLKSKNPDLIFFDPRIELEQPLSDLLIELFPSKRPAVIALCSPPIDSAKLLWIKENSPESYLCKPGKQSELEAAIAVSEALVSKLSDLELKSQLYLDLSTMMNGGDSFFIKHKSQHRKVAHSDIIFVEALKDYVVINTAEKRYTIHSTMKDLERKLPKSKFIRVHRSFIVNREHIAYVDYSEVGIQNSDKVVPIGGSYREDLQARLQFL